MTSANVKFGAKIDSRALNSPHRRTRLASFVLPLTLSSKFAFFPSVDVLHLNRSKDVQCVKSRGLRLVLVQTSGCEVVCTLKIGNPSPFAERETPLSHIPISCSY